MGVVTFSSSAARSPLVLSEKLSTRLSEPRGPSVLSFKTGKTRNATSVAPQKSLSFPMETSKTNEKQLRRAVRHAERVKVIALDEASPSTSELDYNEAAAKLEHIYERSPATSDCDTGLKDHEVKRGRQRRKVVEEDKEVSNNGPASTVVRSKRSKSKRVSLDKRIALRKKKECEVSTASQSKKRPNLDEDEKINKLVREYSASTDLVSVDWKKMKIPPVLPSSEHAWLFNLMQPLKAILQVKENLQSDLGREPTGGELAEATNMDVVELRKKMEVGRAARNKLIKVKLVRMMRLREVPFGDDVMCFMDSSFVMKGLFLMFFRS